MISNCFVFSSAVSRTSSSDLAAVKHHFTTLHFTCTSCDLITIFQWNRSILYIMLLPQNQNVYNLSESYFFWISPKYFPEEDPAANQRRHTANVQAAFTMKSPRQWQSFVPRQWRSVPILHQLLARPFPPPRNIWIFSNIFNLDLKDRKYSLCFISKQSTKHVITSSDTIFQIERKFCCIVHPLCFSLGKESRSEIREIHAGLEMFFLQRELWRPWIFLSEREMFFNSPWNVLEMFLIRESFAASLKSSCGAPLAIAVHCGSMASFPGTDTKCIQAILVVGGNWSRAPQSNPIKVYFLLFSGRKEWVARVPRIYWPRQCNQAPSGIQITFIISKYTNTKCLKDPTCAIFLKKHGIQGYQIGYPVCQIH